MSNKTALVTGATGLLGRQVITVFEKQGWTSKGTGYSRADGVTTLKVDLGDETAVKKVIDDTMPQVIVHCAANRFPDKVDKDPEGTRKLNVKATRSVAKLAAAKSVLLIYMSTDYVFSGKVGEAPYEADAPTRPTNLYGQTKLDGEKAVLEEYQAAGRPGLGIVLRVPVLYGDAETPEESAVNILMDVLWKAQSQPQGPKIRMDHWALRYPTNTADVARVCYDIADKYLGTKSPESLPRVLQFSSDEKFTKYEICKVFGEIMGLPVAGIEADTQGNDANASVQRPYDCHLSTRTLRDLGISVSTVDFRAWWRWRVRAFRK